MEKNKFSVRLNRFWWFHKLFKTSFYKDCKIMEMQLSNSDEDTISCLWYNTDWLTISSGNGKIESKICVY